MELIYIIAGSIAGVVVLILVIVGCYMCNKKKGTAADKNQQKR